MASTFSSRSAEVRCTMPCNDASKRSLTQWLSADLTISLSSPFTIPVCITDHTHQSLESRRVHGRYILGRHWAGAIRNTSICDHVHASADPSSVPFSLDNSYRLYISLEWIRVVTTSVPGLHKAAIDTTFATCQSIAEAISPSSEVYYPGSSHYENDISHWVSAISENATCSVEPGTARDAGTILRLLGKSRAPFAVKGGGHSPNPGFSATKGVHVSMTRFSTIAYDNASQTVELGAGLTWDRVYEHLEPFGVNVVGGRVAGVGVAGFLLGGGLSYKSNQYGLAIDTVQAFELVLPNGTVTSVTAEDHDLWFGLRGGFNNFGIVTKFTMKAFPQTDIWGGYLVVPPSGMDAALDAVEKWNANASDPKAAINSAFIYNQGEVFLYQLLFYDAPDASNWSFRCLHINSEGQQFGENAVLYLFAEYPGYLSIPRESTVRIRTLTWCSMEAFANFADLSGLFHAASVKRFTKRSLETIAAETKFWGDVLTPHSATTLFNVAETFLPDMFSHGTPSAYPPSRAYTLCPVNLYVAWTDARADSLMHDALAVSAARMTELGEPLYTNYALGDVPVEALYGENVGELKRIKRWYDPEDVMGLAGGYKL
ncbi:hypothetical protein EVG20_g7793 [Dentipellis fragilis]|uniref:FAD-binding PCMH-type domain-containing protein n=1 Tax=Dentipellis fragilis TaxID=205917 RepID=A0A4Y9YB99_9AGAM|nr:hypothetical protein EVG20_g7793 [Dentipellis fragilis]